jgi:hypothetical protein
MSLRVSGRRSKNDVPRVVPAEKAIRRCRRPCEMPLRREKNRIPTRETKLTTRVAKKTVTPDIRCRLLPMVLYNI